MPWALRGYLFDLLLLTLGCGVGDLQAWEQHGGHERVPMDLHTACALGDYDCVRMLIAAGGSLDRQNAEGWTPLLYAAYVGHDTIVNLLLETGRCDANARARDGSTALMWACLSGCESVAYFLLSSGALVDARDAAGRTALLLASAKGQLVGNCDALSKLGHISNTLFLTRRTR